MLRTCTISIDGLDGVGKSTVAATLSDVILAQGYKCKVIRSPIEPFRSIRTEVESVGGLTALFYYLAGNSASLNDHYLQSANVDFIIFDRHIYSTLSYFTDDSTTELQARILEIAPKPTFSFHLIVASESLRIKRLDSRSTPRNGSDHLTDSETSAIERRLKSYGLPSIDNSHDDDGSVAASQIWQLVRKGA